ncbi:tetratricopeptide repeat protein [Candidatus Uabimicrobium sp. HlEnr_7]|uniref:tetratricopeptide repeat protein n=1 Tax=Candidatus Uabimicrobium helgolandensis TaxID=3095367 RepID=UPI0035564FB1
MEIGNHRFTPNSIGTLALGLIFLLIGISQFNSSYSEMQYHQNISKGLIFFHSKNYGQAQYHLSKALKIQDGEVGPTALLAKIHLLKGQYKEAQELYEKIEEYAFGEDAFAGQIGNAVCQLYLHENSKSKKTNPSVYRSLESKIKVLSSESPESIDFYILHAHLYLLQSRFFSRNNDKDKELSYMKLASRKFGQAKDKMTEYPPSVMSSLSYYAGVAELNFWEASRLLKETPSPKENSSASTQIYNKFLSAFDHYRIAFLYRDKTYSHIVVNLGVIGDRILSFPWLTPKQRKQIFTRATSYQQETKTFSKHLYSEYKSSKTAKKEWFLEKSKAYIENGTAISNIYTKNYGKCRFNLARRFKIAFSPSNDRYARMLLVDQKRKNKTLKSNFSDIFLSAYRKSVRSLLEKEKFVPHDTVFLANFFYISAVTNYSRKASSFSEKLAKILSSLPDKKVIIDGRPLTYKRILMNNLYYVYKSNPHKKDLAKKYRKYAIK